MDIDWKLEYEKENGHWRDIATILSDFILMADAHSAGECEYDGKLHDQAMDLVEMFRSRATAPFGLSRWKR